MPNLSQFHNPKWKESPALQGCGLTHFHLVADANWYDVHNFLRFVALSCVGRERFTIKAKAVPFSSILSFIEQMKFQYNSARRDSFTHRD